MPEITVIKKFNEDLVSLGSEPEILEERGEEVEEVNPPEAKISGDLAELLGTEEDTDALTDTFEEELEESEESEEPEEPLLEESEEPENILDMPDDTGELEDEFTDIFTEEESEEPSFELPGETPEEPLDISDELPELPSDFGEISDQSIETMEEGPKEDLEPEDLSSMELDTIFTDQKSGEENELDILPKDFEDFSPGESGEEIPTDDILSEFDTEEETEESYIDEEAQEPEETLEDLELDSFAEDIKSKEFSEEDLLGDSGIEEDAEIIDELTEQEPTSDMDFEMPDEFQVPPEGESPPEETVDEIPDMPDIDTSFLPSETTPEDTSLPEEEKIEDISTPLDEGLRDLGTGDEDFQIDEFSLPEIGEEFGLKEQETGTEAPEELGTELPSSFEFPEEIQGETEKIDEEQEFIKSGEAVQGEQEFTEEQFMSMQNTLGSLPLNLRIVVEELIGEDQISGDNSNKLLKALIQKRTAREIASLVTKITGKKISIPKRFEKKTGIEFEEERKTFAYAFRKNIIPLLKIMLPALTLLAIIIFGTIYLLMIPLWANDVYGKGYNLLLDNYFKEADEKFYTAFNIIPEQHWMLKSWFYKYAEGYEERKQYDYARDKYKLLLNVYPGDKKGILGWAGLESGIHEYEESNKILDFYLLENEPFDFDGLLLKGDNYFNWAKTEPENSETHLKDAQDTYERLLLKHSDKDEAWMHLLRFTIFTDNFEQTMHIKKRFDDNKNAKVDPLIYSELAGYLIDKDELLDVDDVLERAKKIDETLPEIHYQYSRYFKEIGNLQNEEIALMYVIDYLTNNKDQSLSVSRQKERLIMQINSYNRMGEIFVGRGLVEDAEKKFFDIAIAHIENGQSERGAGNLDYLPEFGKVYSNKGDLYYYYEHYSKAIDPDDLELLISDDNQKEDYTDYFLDIALENYMAAEKNHYSVPELEYKIGYIEYSKNEFEEAFKGFYSLRSIYNNNPNFVFSLGNTLYNKRDYYGAQGYYKYLIELLKQKENEFIQIRPDENPTQYNLINNMLIAHNNLGVIYAKLSELTREPDKEIQAKVHFLQSSQYADQILRNPETLKRGLTQSYGYLNTQEILKDTQTKEYLYYNILPLDMSQGNWQNYEIIE